MIKSMTGYGQASDQNEHFYAEMELRSVNNRFLDLKISLPRELNYLEQNIRYWLSQKIRRGKVEIRIKFKDLALPRLELDEERLKAYWSIYQQAKITLGSDQAIPLEKVISEKDVINIPEQDLEERELELFIHNLLNKVLAEHDNMALKEGFAMFEFLDQSLENCLSSLDKIEAFFPEYKSAVFKKLKGNIESVLESQIDQDALSRLLLEAALYTEKADITEEIIRLRDHFEKFRQRLKSDQPEAGKSLNFILQEMHREINTIGSKFNSVESYDYILQIKEEIEKCREIVQNVE